jgi:hypothetical protein
MAADHLTTEQRKEIEALAKKTPNMSALDRFYYADHGTIQRWLEERLKTKPKWEDAPCSGRSAMHK